MSTLCSQLFPSLLVLLDDVHQVVLEALQVHARKGVVWGVGSVVHGAFHIRSPKQISSVNP